MTARTRVYRSTRKDRAFTLVEILVTLVILLIGILAVLRLFPPGFLTIQRTAEMTNAQALAQQQMDTLKALSVLPDSIEPAHIDQNGNQVIDALVTPDDLSNFDGLNQNQLPFWPNLWANTTGYDLSDINRVRGVINETVRIPTPSPNAVTAQLGAVYMLQFGPVFNNFPAITNQTNNTDSLAISGAPMQRTLYSAQAQLGQPDPSVILTNDAQYAIDANRQWIAFYPRIAAQGAINTGRTYNVTYDYYVKDPNTGNIVLETEQAGPASKIFVPDENANNYPAGEQASPRWIPLFNNAANQYPNSLALPVPAGQAANFLGMRPNSEEVARAFVLLSENPFQNGGAPPQWTSDPYQYVWYSGQIAGTDANPGVLLFNPAAHNYTEQTPNGPQPLTARINYTIYDNHIVRDDRMVPMGAPYDVKLSLPYVLTNGDTLTDGTTYQGIFRGANNNVTPDLVIYNANTGQEIGAYQGAQSVAGQNMIGFTLNAKDGIVRINAADGANLQGVPLRFFYRAQKEWGQQVQKANAHYFPMDPTTFQNNGQALPYNYFWVGGSSPNIQDNPNYIYFPLCEEGKSIIIGKLYYTPTQPNAQPVELDNQEFQISTTPASIGPSQNRFAYVDVSQVATNIQGGFTLSNGPEGNAAVNVQGVSVKSRVIWRDVSRWRKVDNDSILATNSP